MKVYIGPYRSRWISTIHDHHMIRKYGLEWTDNQDWKDRAWERAEDALQWIYNHTINLYFDKRPSQKISVHIDRWDTWSMDYTLARIILPMLEQLAASKHGSPFVDDDDVPEELRSASAPPKENDWDIDDFQHKRWEWVIGEMIWTFEQKIKGDWESQYYKFEDCVPNPKAKTFFEQIGTKLVWEDPEGRKAHQKRMTNGFRLFGKYYEALWD